MSEHVSVSREIGAPAEALWAMVADVTRMPEWSPETVAVQWIGGATGPEPGVSFRGTNRNGAKRWKSVATVVDAEPGKVFRFRVKAVGLRVAEWCYSFEPTASGCRVTESWTDNRNRLLTLVSGRVTGVSDRPTHNRLGMERTLERLAAVAEGAPD